MKNIAKVFLVTFISLLFASCYDRDVIDSKGIHYPLPKVENLDYSKSGNTVKLTWQIPGNIPAEFVRPLEISVQKVENDIYTDKITITNEGTSTDNIAIDASKKYRFIVKLVGYLNDDAKQAGISSKIFSEGQVIEIQ
ncbi:DUF4945 domain-containing protein [uncultured Bacteroides sp.]|uniref:DUF4945 domain-containing protein n=1 Tax=uncultured Bacteroides sp. TaxID=162156 RepID=UPI0026013DDE|nr:DUF4945 domain-containing protein [uncultured Bacteroides sp.]